MTIAPTLKKLALATTTAAILLTSAPAANAAMPSNQPSSENVQNEACRTFTDAAPGSSFYESIRWMACEGLTNGYADGSFGKNKEITRGEVASFLYRYSGENHNAGNRRDFTDVNPQSSHFEAISWMEDKDYTNGYADGSYGINKNISRGELAAFIYRFADEDFSAPRLSPFKDMTPTSSFYEPITWMSSHGMVNGYVDDTFKSGRSVTRGETSKYFYSLDKHLNGDSGDNEQGPVTGTFLSYKASNGTNLRYHYFADGVDWSKPVGAVLYFDGDGTTNFERPDRAYIQSIARAARSDNKVLVFLEAPNVPRNWWEHGISKTADAVTEMTKVKVLPDLDDEVLLTGYSGGAEFLSFGVMNKDPDWLPANSGALMIGGGGTYGYRIQNADSKTDDFTMRWVVGDQDGVGATFPAEWSAYAASAEAVQDYKAAGFKKSTRTVVPGDHHDYDWAGLISQTLKTMP